LIEAHVDRRQQQPQSMQRGVKLALQAIGQTTTLSQPPMASTIAVKRRCQLCSRERDRKVITHCARQLRLNGLTADIHIKTIALMKGLDEHYAMHRPIDPRINLDTSLAARFIILREGVDPSTV
ncbi:unnamed protein product, partial [Rotaria magnacalcarata]